MEKLSFPKLLLKGKVMRVGITGCGRVSGKHISPLSRMTGVEIIGICDLDKEKMARTARAFGIKNVYPNLRRMLNEQKPEVVLSWRISLKGRPCRRTCSTIRFAPYFTARSLAVSTALAACCEPSLATRIFLNIACSSWSRTDALGA